MKNSKVGVKILTNFFLFLAIIGLNSFDLTATIETNYVVNANSNLEIEIIIEEKDVSLNINFKCDKCNIDFIFLDNDNYIKYTNSQSYNERIVVRDRESYTNRIFINTNGSWWIIFENKDFINKTLDFDYEEVDPPVTEDRIFWIILIPWLIGFFAITSFWFYRKKGKP
ncbi:MAG: hypothetical protein HeimC3_07410 [Candidatus Heimdallarchaeota archaeon LC_3]|nr:MAG: hypothetical protein HeimC3_07410 [Candidatus Heimdallarchaeota archaeon LC_3]